MGSTRPPFVYESGNKGMWLRSRMAVCWGLRLSKICKFLRKRVRRNRFH